MQVLREPKTKITARTIEAAWRRRAPDTRIVIGDAECPGLKLVVHPTRMTWSLEFRPHGLDRAGRRFPMNSAMIGSPETHSPTAARTEANRLKGEVRLGRDPGQERRAARREAIERRARTAETVLETYGAYLSTRQRLRGQSHGRLSSKWAGEELAHLKRALADAGAATKPVEELDVSHVRRLLLATPEQPAVTRHRFGALSRFLDWALDEGLVKTNPCAAIGKQRRPRPPQARERVLSLAELATLWIAAEGLPSPVWRDFVRMLIALPVRRSEGAARMDWSHIDFDARTWTQPGRLTKNREPHRLHLHPLALMVLRERYEIAGKPKSGFVFPSPRAGTEIVAFSSIMKALRPLAPSVGHWVLHDIRRSFASALGEAGHAEVVVDAVLNHRQSGSRSGVLAVYQRSLRWVEQIEAVKSWGAMLQAALDGAPVEAGIPRLATPHAP
jgi:integrase